MPILRMLRCLLVLFVSCWGFLSAGITAQTGVNSETDVNSQAERLPLVAYEPGNPPHLLTQGEYTFFHDPSGSLSADAVQKLLFDGPVLSDPLDGRYGYLDGALWLAFRITVPRDCTDVVVCEGYGIDSFRVWFAEEQVAEAGVQGAVPEPLDGWQTRNTGWATDADTRGLPLRHVTAVFELGPPGGSLPVSASSPRAVSEGGGDARLANAATQPQRRVFACLLRLESNTSLSRMIQIADSRTFLAGDQGWLIFLGSIYALMITCILGMLWLAFRYRQKLFLLLVVYVFMSGIYVLYGYGFGNWLLWPSMPVLGRIVATWGWAVIALVNIHFLMACLDLGKNSRPAWLFGIASLGVLAITALVLMVLDQRTAYRLASLSGLAFPLCAGILVAAAIRLRIKGAVIFALSLLVMTCCLLAVNLRNMGLWGDSMAVDILVASTLFSQWITFMLPLYLKHRYPAATAAELQSPGQGAKKDKLFSD